MGQPNSIDTTINSSFIKESTLLHPAAQIGPCAQP
jgi:hypothetical protein